MHDKKFNVRRRRGDGGGLDGRVEVGDEERGEGVKVPEDRNDSIWNPGSAISFFFCPFLPPPLVSTSSSFFIAVFPHKSAPA